MRKSYLWAMMAMLIFLAACSGQNSTQQPTSQSNAPAAESGSGDGDNAASEPEPEPLPLYTIQILTPNQYDFKFAGETTIFKVIKDKFNIDFELIPYSGNYQDKLNTMLAAGDYPELVRLEQNELVKRYIQAGALVALDDFLADSPDFTERFAENIPFWRSVASDGKLYKWEFDVPQDGQNVCECLDLAVRIDALEKQGWPELLSEDDYVSFLKQALIDFPATNNRSTIGMVAPFAESWGLAGITTAMPEKGDSYLLMGGKSVLFNVKERKFEDLFMTRDTIDSFRFLNRLYREGILDKESFTDNNAQVQEKMNAGQALSVWYANWTADAASPRLREAGHPELQYIALPIRSNNQMQEGGKRPLRVDSTRPIASVAITKNAKDPQRLFELINWAASEEGQILLQAGVEGVHYNIVDGKRVPTQQYKDGIANDPNYKRNEGFNIVDLLGRVKTVSPVDGQFYLMEAEPTLRDELTLSEEQRNAYRMMGYDHKLQYWVDNGEEFPMGVASAISLNPADSFGLVEQQIIELRKKYTAQLILAENDAAFERILAEGVEAHQKLNPQDVIDEYNRLLEEAASQIK